MPTFQYTAVDAKNKTKKGSMEVDSSKEVKQKLLEMGCIPLEIIAVKEKKQSSNAFSVFSSSVSKKELALTTRQLATLLAAGLPLEHVLSAVSEQTESKQMKRIISAVRHHVVAGHSLASSLIDHPDAFSELYCAAIAAGEQSGHLDQILEHLANYTEQESALLQKIQQALIYPSVMITVSLGILIFLLEYVVPKMMDVYGTMGQALPTLTLILIALSTHLKSIGIYLLLGIVGSILLFRYTLKNNATFRTRVHGALLHIPVIGRTIKTANTARFSRTFSMLSSAGVPMLDAMMIAAQLISNLVIRNAIENATNLVREGAQMSFALKQTHYFSTMSIQLMMSGEASGQLETMLERTAGYQETEIRRLIDTSLALFEPIMILTMGSMVLFIVLAILLPIFQLDQLTGS